MLLEITKLPLQLPRLGVSFSDQGVGSLLDIDSFRVVDGDLLEMTLQELVLLFYTCVLILYLLKFFLQSLDVTLVQSSQLFVPAAL